MHLIAPGAQAVLDERAVFVVGEAVEFAPRCFEQAEPVDVLYRCWHFTHCAHLTRGRVDAEHTEAVVVTVGGHCQVHGAFAQRESGTHIDIVQAPHFKVLQPLALQVVHLKAVLFIGAQDPAQCRILRVNPDGRVIRCIALTDHRFGLHHGFDHRQWRRGTGRGRLPVQQPLEHLLVAVILHQHLQPLRRLAHRQVFRLFERVQRQSGHWRPTVTVLLVQVQVRRFRVQAEHPARHQRHGPGGLFHLTKGLDQRHGHPRGIGLGVGRVHPPADFFFIHKQLLPGIVNLTELGIRR